MITLSIVSHRQAALVASLLSDVARVGSHHVTTIIVTHNVPEDVPAWPDALASRITTIHNATPRGFGANHNQAFERCTTPYFTVMNPDLRLIGDPFDQLLAPFSTERNRSVAGHRLGMVAPAIVTDEGFPADSTRGLMTPLNVIRRRLVMTSRTPSSMPDWLAGMFLLLSSGTFRAIGGFDERYFMYCEDFDLCARLRLEGWRFEVAEQAVVVHMAQRASHRSRRHLLWHVASLARMWLSATFWRYRRLLRAERSHDFGRQLVPRE